MLKLITLLQALLCCLATIAQSYRIIAPPPQPPRMIPRNFVPYPPLREADVMWSKRVWRTMDLREKFNHPFYYPEEITLDRTSLFDLVKYELLNDSIVYHAFANPALDDEFKVPLSGTELRNIFSQIIDSVKKEMLTTDVKQWWIKEDWFFDKQRSVMDVRIIGLCPLKEKVSESGEVLGYMPVFWLYFPEWRMSFARTPFYNVQNNFQRISYDDAFLKRKFQSYIHKESNVFDRSIQSYYTGLDALLEAERIKEEIFRYEHDLWHF